MEILWFENRKAAALKILLTGANGYLGKGIVKRLLDDGIEVVATDYKDNLIDKRATIKTADLFHIEDPYHYFGEPDVLFHMAWRDGFVHNSPNHINDLPRHHAFISRMIDLGVRRVVVMGSMHEVGFFEGSINESTPCNPQSLYGISKNALRRLVELKCKEKNCVFQWLRGFYIVGNRKKKEKDSKINDCKAVLYCRKHGRRIFHLFQDCAGRPQRRQGVPFYNGIKPV